MAIKGGTTTQVDTNPDQWLTGGSPVVASPAKAAPLTAQGVSYINQGMANTNSEQQSLNASAGQTGSIASDMADLQSMGMSAADAQTLSNWYQGQQDALVPPGTILSNFYQTPIFAKYFPGIKAQMAAGNQSPMSIQDYVSFKQDVNGMTSSLGLPKGFVTDEDIGSMVASNMTLSDVGTRISQAENAATSSNPQTLALMKSLYGVDVTTAAGKGALTGYFLNPSSPLYGPNDAQNTFNAANVGALAQGLGYQNLDKSQLLAAAQTGGTVSSEKGGLEANAPLLGLEKPLAGSNANALETVAPGTVLAQGLNQATGAQQRNIIGAGEARGAAGSGGGGFGTESRGLGVGSASEGGAKSDPMGG
jgi:hypothetical protein